jgi:8-oxo-dGTP diphosphatase
MNTFTDCTQINWDSFEFVDEAVLVFMKQKDTLLLIEKKRGLGAGKYNAPGGRIDPGETPYQAAVRECQEEVFMTPKNLSYVTSLQFIFRDGYSIKGYVFLTEEFSGTPGESDEAKPFWCSQNELPFHNMWEDDRYWLPLMLQGNFVKGRFIFDDDTMVSLCLESSKNFEEIR